MDWFEGNSRNHAAAVMSSAPRDGLLSAVLEHGRIVEDGARDNLICRTDDRSPHCAPRRVKSPA
ncbi:hypothetical protein [Mycobacterium sp. URHB0021]